MSLSRAGWTDQQDVGRRLQIATGAQFVDELAVDPRGGVDVEIVQRGRGGYAGESQPAGEAAGGAGLDFYGQQSLQCHREGQSLGAGLVEHRGQRFGASVQFERGQM
jgi:hypothetical protein